MPLPYDRQPLRVVVGETRIPSYYRVFDRFAPTLLVQSRDPDVVVQKLVENGIRHVWLEGGPRLAGGFWNAGFVDRVIGYIAPAMLGSGRAAWKGKPRRSLTCGRSTSPTCAASARTSASSEPPARHARTEGTQMGRVMSTGRRGRELMFTGLVEEQGSVVGIERSAIRCA